MVAHLTTWQTRKSARKSVRQMTSASRTAGRAKARSASLRLILFPLTQTLISGSNPRRHSSLARTVNSKAWCLVLRLVAPSSKANLRVSVRVRVLAKHPASHSVLPHEWNHRVNQYVTYLRNRSNMPQAGSITKRRAKAVKQQLRQRQQTQEAPLPHLKLPK